MERLTPQVVFFDTFTHNAEGQKIDQIRLSHPTTVRELRVIPCGRKGAERYGLTSPSHFLLEVFALNLDRPNGHVFERIGRLDYSDNCTVCLMSVGMSTTHVVLVGNYMVLTVAVVGNTTAPPSQPHMIARPLPALHGAPIPTIGARPMHNPMVFNPHVPPPSMRPQLSMPPPMGLPPPMQTSAPFDLSRPPPSPAVMHPPPGVVLVPSQVAPSPSTYLTPRSPPPRESRSKRSESRGRESRDRDRTSRERQRSSSSRRRANNSEPKWKPIGGEEESHPKKGKVTRAEAGHSQDESASINSSIIPGKAETSERLENISDEEDEFLSVDANVDLSEADEKLLDRVTSQFRPNDIVLKPLNHFDPPWLTKSAMAYNKLKDDISGEMCEDGLCTFVKTFSSGFSRDSANWLIGMEKFVCDLPAAMNACCAHLNKSDLGKALFKWTAFGLHLRSAVQHTQPAFIIRHLKVGLRLCLSVFPMCPNISKKLIQRKVQHTLVDLLEQQHMSLPLQLLIVCVLEASVYHPCGMQAMQRQSREPDDCSPEQEVDFMTPYQRFSTFLTANQNCRLLSLARCLMRRLSVHECLERVSRHNNNLSCPKDVLSVCLAIREITACHQYANQLLPMDPAVLPVSKVYSLRESLVDPYPALYNDMLGHGLVTELYRLCSVDAALRSYELMTAVRELLVSLLSMRSGVLFLACQKETTTMLLSKLMHIMDDMDDSEQRTLTELRETGKDAAYCIYALQCIDCLLEAPADSTNTECRTVLEPLHALYCATMQVQGRTMVCRVLSWEDNIAAVLPCLEPTGDPDVDNNVRKSACHGYACELLLTVLRTVDCAQALIRVSPRLAKICAQDGANTNPRLLEVRQWVDFVNRAPAERPELVEYLSDRVKGYVTEGVSPRIPRGLITALRMLREMVIGEERHPDCGVPEQIKYDDAMLKMYSTDVFTCLVQLINKMCDSYLINWQQGVCLHSKEGSLFLSCLSPAISIIRAVVCKLVRVRREQFADTSMVVPLVNLYSLTCSMHTFREGWCHLVQHIHGQIIATLSQLTRPSTLPVEKSLWSRTVKLILEHAHSAPHWLVGAICCISELVPLPLVLPRVPGVMESSLEDLIFKRKEWAEYLTPVHSQLEELVVQLSVTTHPALQQTLKRLCLQLVDLDATLALVIVKSVLTCCVRESEEGEPTDPSVRLPCTRYMSFVLHTLLQLCSHDSFKSAMLHVLTTSDKDIYSRLIPNCIAILGHTSKQHGHVTSQELILSVLAVLCDYRVGLKLTEGDDPLFRVMPLPLMHSICAGVFVLVARKHWSSVTQALKLVVQLCDFDWAVKTVEDCLRKQSDVLLDLVTRLIEDHSTHEVHYLSALDTFLRFISSLLSLSTYRNSQLRTQILGSEFVRSLLEKKTDKDEIKSMVKLGKVVQRCKESKCKLVVEKITNVMKLVNGDIPGGIFEEPNVQPPDLEMMFSKRELTVKDTQLEDDKCRLSHLFWFPQYSLQDLDQTACEKITCDLESIRHKFMPQFDPKEELLKRVSVKQIDRPKRVRGQPHRIINTSKGEKKLTPAPLRGRGFMPRGHMNSRVKDHFRSRQQNTSRAPSTHVDDFVVMEGNSKPMHHDANRRRPDPPNKFRYQGASRSRFVNRRANFGRGRANHMPPKFERRDLQKRRDPPVPFRKRRS